MGDVLWVVIDEDNDDAVDGRAVVVVVFTGLGLLVFGIFPPPPPPLPPRRFSAAQVAHDDKYAVARDEAAETLA